MADAVGTLAKAAMKKDAGLDATGVTYPQTPGGSDMAAGHQIPFTSEGLVKAITRAPDPSLVGAQAQPASPIIAEPTSGTLVGRARWRGFERLFMLALGFELPNGDDGSPKLIGSGEGTKAVVTTTNATPIVVTVTTHGYATGDGVRIVGVTGNTAANGDWSIVVLTGDTFELVDSSGNGAHGGSPTAEKYNAAAHLFEGDNEMQDYPWDGTDGRNPGFDSDDRKVRRFQMAIAKQVSDHNFYSCFVNKITLTGNPNEVTLTVDLLCYNRLTGSYNSASWTLPVGTTAQVLFRQMQLSMGLRTGGEGGVVVYRPDTFELSVDNKLKGDDQSTESGVNHEIPVRDGFRETTLKITVPRYDSDLWGTLFDIDSEYAGKMIFAGPTIAGGSGSSYSWGFFMSSLRFDEFNSNVAGPGRLPISAAWRAEKPLGSDIFEAGNYLSISLQKDSEIVAMFQNEDPQNYLTEY